MTPAASWTPDDYYTASRAAREAWERTSDQLSLGLDERSLTPPSVACADAPLSRAGTGTLVEPNRLTSGAEPRHATGLTANQARVSAHPVLDSGVGVGANSTTTEASANLSTERARLQEGA